MGGGAAACEAAAPRKQMGAGPSTWAPTSPRASGCRGTGWGLSNLRTRMGREPAELPTGSACQTPEVRHPHSTWISQSLDYTVPQTSRLLPACNQHGCFSLYKTIDTTLFALNSPHPGVASFQLCLPQHVRAPSTPAASGAS